jgi:hypothetical protein
MLNIEQLKSNPNPDLTKERDNGNVDIVKLKSFMGTTLFRTSERHKLFSDLSKSILNFQF